MAKEHKNSGDSRCWWGCGERGTLLHFWWDCKLVQPLWKLVWWFLRKLNRMLPEDPMKPLLGIYPEDSPACNKDTCYSMVIAALFVIARSWKEPRCSSMEEWIQKKCGIITQWKTTWLLKPVNSWNSWANGWNRIISCLVRKPNHKRTHIVFTHW